MSHNVSESAISSGAASADAGLKFELRCGVDFSGKGQAVDIGSVKVDSMDKCMDACAGNAKCTGAGWGFLEGDKGNAHMCYLKANLTQSHNATADWSFAVLQGPADSSSKL